MRIKAQRHKGTEVLEYNDFEEEGPFDCDTYFYALS